MKKSALAITLASLLSPVSSLQAQETSADETVVVIGKSENVNSISDIPANIVVIGQDEIKASGATSLSSLLRSRAGIQISDSNSGPVFSLRGFSGEQAANNTLILVNGRKLNKPDLSSPQLSSILLSQIEKVEVLSGSAGVLYGDQAVGGVINIITKHNTESHQEVGVSVGSHDSYSGNVSLSNTINDNWSFSLAASQDNSDNYRDHNKRETGNLLGRVDFVKEDKEFYTEISYYDNYRQYAGSLTEEQYNSDPTQASTSYPDDYSHEITTAYRLGYKQSLLSNWLAKGDVSYDDTSTTGLSYSSPFQKQNKQLGLLAQLERSLITDRGQGNVLFGLDYSRNDFEYLSSYIGREDVQNISSIYMQLNYPMLEDLVLVTGARYSQAEDDIKDQSTYISGETLSEDANSFELGLNFKPSKSTRMYLRGETNFRFAKVDEQAYTPADVHGLKPQRGKSLEAGIDYAVNDYSVKVDIYNLKLKDEIVYDSSADAPTGVSYNGANVNADESERYGGSIYADKYITDNVLLGAEYSYIDAEFTKGDNEGNELPWVAKHSGRAFINYEITINWQVLAEGVYVGKKYQDGDSGNTEEQLDDYWLSNLALHYTDNSFSANLRVDNAFDKDYADYAYYNGYSTGFYSGNGRTFKLTASYQF